MYVYILVPWWQLSSISSLAFFADCCDYGYLSHLILSLSIFLHPSMWSAFQSLIGYPLMPLASHFLQGTSFSLPVQALPFRTLWHSRQWDSSQEREVPITWMAFLDKQNHYNVKLVYLCLLWLVYVCVLVPWWQLSSSSSRTRFADCCDYGYLSHLILSLSIFLQPSMWSAFQSLIGYPLMPLTSHFLQGTSFALPVQAFRPISHFHSDKWPFMCDPRMCHFHSQHHATGLNLASTI